MTRNDISLAVVRVNKKAINHVRSSCTLFQIWKITYWGVRSNKQKCRLNNINSNTNLYVLIILSSDCGCSAEGVNSPNCSQFGVCDCLDNYDGPKCDRCSVGYYNYPKCVKCACDTRGSQHQFCEATTGQCACKGSFRGINCNLCRSGYYGFPNCRACQCNPAGIKPLPDRPLGDCSLSNEVCFVFCIVVL